MYRGNGRSTSLHRCRKRGIVLIMSGLQAQPARVVRQMHLQPEEGALHFTDDFPAALELSRKIVEGRPTGSME